MVEEMTAGTENFGRKMAQAMKYMSEFAEFMIKEDGDSFVLPMDSRTSMLLFLRWMARSTGRARSLPSVTRAIGAICARARVEVQ